MRNMRKPELYHKKEWDERGGDSLSGKEAYDTL